MWGDHERAWAWCCLKHCWHTLMKRVGVCVCASELESVLGKRQTTGCNRFRFAKPCCFVLSYTKAHTWCSQWHRQMPTEKGDWGREVWWDDRSIEEQIETGGIIGLWLIEKQQHSRQKKKTGRHAKKVVVYYMIYFSKFQRWCSCILPDPTQPVRIAYIPPPKSGVNLIFPDW